MRSNLQIICKSWHKNYTSAPKTTVKSKKQFIKISNKRNDENSSELKTEGPLLEQKQSSSSQIKRIITKLSNFIQKIEETLKKILYQKDIKWYITYAQTSQAQIIDNFNNSLEKFRNVLYELKEKRNSEDSTNNSNLLLSSPSDSMLSKESRTTKQNGSNLQRINYDVLSLLLQYFQDHMIAETHWSTKEKQSNMPEIFQKYLAKFRSKMSCKSSAQSDVTLQNLPQIQITRTMSRIVEEMNKEQQQSASHSSQEGELSQFYMKPVEETLNAVLKIENLKPIQKMEPIQKIAYLLDLQSKIFVSSQFIESAVFFQDDITTLSRQKFVNVWRNVHENDMGDKDLINLQYKVMKMLMIITNASVIRELQFTTTENTWFKKIVFGLSFPRYFFDYGRAKLQNHKFLRKPNVQTTKSIWNLPENGLISQLKKPLIFDAIECNREFYIPRTNSRNLKNFKNRIYDDKLNIFLPNQNSFKVRLLNYKHLETENIKNCQSFQTIVIHYHGGGFIALSSCTSQSYTRKWANSLKVPVFSVDYGKPPEFRFPTPVLDCLDAYHFISTQIQKYFNIRPKRIFVAGDSAGGNLTCSLTAMTMKLDMKVPDGLLLAYPAVDTRTKFTPSRINSFNDTILYPTLLLLCMQEYLGKVENQNNPLASPILLTEDYVSDNGDQGWPKKWPKTIVLVGKKDPLYDDSIRLCERLASSNIEFHCEIYKKLSHAFLSIDKMLPECGQTIQDSIKFFEKLMSGQNIGVRKLL